MKLDIILAVKDPKRQAAYRAALEEYADCVVVDALRLIPGLTGKAPYHGILIDLPLNVRSTYLDKLQISDSLAVIPNAILNLSPGSGAIKLLMAAGGDGSTATLAQFIALCAATVPRIVYPHNRIPLNLNVLLSSTPAFGADAERTFTMNVSEGGCFLATAVGLFQPQDMVWIDFTGLDHRAAVKGRVCWQRAWGTAHAAPGIGVCFEAIGVELHREIMALLERTKAESNKRLFV